MKFSAILLAGGLSSRMGQNKALLTQQGVTLLQLAHDKITDAMTTFPESQILVSGNYPEYNSILDIKTARGPIEGIWSCTRRIEDRTAVLVFPVDMPLLISNQFKLLFEQVARDFIKNKDTEFVQFENWEMPFVFIYNSKTEKILASVRNSENKSKRSIRYFKSRLKGKIISAVSTDNFKNVNTPADWKEVNL